MKLIIPIFLGTILVIVWTSEWIAGAHLRVQIDALSDVPRELADARAEHARLEALQLTPDAQRSLQRDAAERDLLLRELESREHSPLSPQTESLASGDRTVSANWRNRGQATPHAAIETTLWAAAGGDLRTLKNALFVPDSVRAQIEELHARLSDAARLMYPTTDDLIAAVTAKAIPLGEAQVVWQQQTGDDDAIACVVLTERNNRDASTPTDKNAPPALRSNTKVSTTTLTLHRSGERWQLVVPPAAFTKIEREFGLSTPK